MCGIAGYVGKARLSVGAIDETQRMQLPDSQHSTQITLANQQEVVLHSRLRSSI